ncbi:hypothetical protein GCM10027413_07960 [Conyzicola nivalis]|uniref:Uncharacterized protein n=1 Tax=Conyzicola nivalis TaxID=1477021 RepID=A0A916WIU4_9MICO|nr:hypothetical protein [Conyzicola nivalis]GGB04245.1 hypothetical protein GCM10010979_18670 [Conyzicola nivalis]
MRYLTVLSALLVGAGVACAATALLGYVTRYSMFDGLYAEIDPTLYLRITAMTSFEKAAVVCGIAAVVSGLAIAVVRLIVARRATNT